MPCARSGSCSRRWASDECAAHLRRPAPAARWLRARRAGARRDGGGARAPPTLLRVRRRARVARRPARAARPGRAHGPPRGAALSRLRGGAARPLRTRPRRVPGRGPPPPAAAGLDPAAGRRRQRARRRRRHDRRDGRAPLRSGPAGQSHLRPAAPPRRGRAGRAGARRAVPRARRHRGAPVGQRAASRAGSGLRGALRGEGAHRERRHVPRRSRGPRGGAAHDRGASGGIRPHPRRLSDHGTAHPRRARGAAVLIDKGDRMKTLTLTLALAAVALAGCGSSDKEKAASTSTPTATPTATATAATGGASAGGGQVVKLAADPSALKFDKSTLTAKAGKVTLSMANPSGLPHAVAIEGHGVDVDGNTVQKGGTSTATAKLKPGTYEFYCPVDGHRQAGMEGKLTVQ